MICAPLFFPCGLHAVCKPDTQGTECDPAEQPREIERESEYRGIDAVPELDRETHTDEGNQAQQESGERGLLYRHGFTEYSLSASGPE